MDIEIMKQIETHGSRLDKERLLSTIGKDSVKFLKWALDPMITFGVTVDEVDILKRYDPAGLKLALDKDFWKLFDGLCKQLSGRYRTGNAAAESIHQVMNKAPSEQHVIWACRVLNKDLRCGFSVSTLNKVFPGAIEPFACALAKPYEPDKHEIRGVWRVEPKLDGLRMVVMDGVAYTRNGRTIDSVAHIIADLENLGALRDYVFDGEIMGSTNFDEDSGKIRKKGAGANTSLVYNIFDCVPKDEWDSRKTRSYEDRRQLLLTVIAGKPPESIKIVESTKLVDPNSEELFDARDKYIKMGYEGAMLKDASSPYIFKRSDSVLKLKDFQDADGRITSCFEGKGKHKGRLGGFVAEFDGVSTRVGSGFSDAQRDMYWKDRDSLIGKMIEVQYQNMTEEGSLRFPVFIKFRPDKE